MIGRTWRWRVRSNPLRRRSYAVEAWALLAFGIVAIVTAVLVGGSVAHGLQDRYAQERLERHSSKAVLTQDAPEGFGATRVSAAARWSAPDGTVRTGTVKASPESSRGAVIGVWTDANGALVPAPLPELAGQFQADVIGAGAASGVSVAALLAGAFTARFLDRRRYERWTADWARADARWGNRNV
ncbi:hypothetical protein ABZ901_05800 [Actinacidiphila alni]|uniref:Rv1733c family protein n=1 Tax=Actinacidiphila alni TaxID=380248 RepID=UPI0033D15A72